MPPIITLVPFKSNFRCVCPETEAHLKGTGRDLPEDVDLMLTWDTLTCCWQPAGRGGLVLKSRVQQDILDALTAADGMGLTTARLAVILGRDRGNISKELQELVARGIVLPCQKQGKEQPYKLNPDYEYHSLN